MIELILVRHGDAEPKAEGKEDRERRLVEKGVIQMRRVANLVELLGFRLDKILASPYVRAIQSAQAISEELEDDVKVETIKELEPDQDPSALLNRLRGMDEKGRNTTILIVGHEPYLSRFIKLVTGGEVELKKGGVAVIKMNATEGKGSLELLLNQKVLKRL